MDFHLNEPDRSFVPHLSFIVVNHKLSIFVQSCVQLSGTNRITEIHTNYEMLVVISRCFYLSYLKTLIE